MKEYNQKGLNLLRFSCKMDRLNIKTPSRWTFEFKNENMTDKELQEYQNNLIEIREKYEKHFKIFPKTHFHQGAAPPEDNVFARFTYECKLHEGKTCLSKFSFTFSYEIIISIEEFIFVKHGF